MTDTNTYQAQANELSQKLWAIANDLRGQMDASEFKNYITENNRKLVNYLEKIGYITSSWEEKTDSNGQVIIIGCRIKQKR